MAFSFSHWACTEPHILECMFSTSMLNRSSKANMPRRNRRAWSMPARRRELTSLTCRRNTFSRTTAVVCAERDTSPRASFMQPRMLSSLSRTCCSHKPTASLKLRTVSANFRNVNLSDALARSSIY